MLIVSLKCLALLFKYICTTNDESQEPNPLQVMDQEIIDVDMDENSCSIMFTEGMDGKSNKGKVIHFVYEIWILT